MFSAAARPALGVAAAALVGGRVADAEAREVVAMDLSTGDGPRVDPATGAPCFEAAELTHGALGTRWPQDGAGMAGIPKRAWPPIQPEMEAVPALRAALAACEGSGSGAKRHACEAERFVLATALASYKETMDEGAALYARDADASLDAACALAQMYLAGTGVDLDGAEAARLFERGAAAGHAQSKYELGVLYYCGDDDVEEDEARAFALWREAALDGHVAAAFMVGDCLNDGLVGPKDPAAAMRWWVFAGDKGHRGARSRAFALTQPKTSDDETGHGRFTDASRQTVRRITSTPSDAKAKQAVRRRTTDDAGRG